MASIRKRGNRWQAMVRCNGHSSSHTDATEKAVRAWAKEEEARIRALVPQWVKEQGQGQIRGHRVVAGKSKADILKHARVYPRVCGVYFLIKDDEIVYVGQSLDIMGRLSEHNKDKKQFDKFAYVDVPEKDLREVEYQYILVFRPRWNIRSNGVAGIGGSDGFYS